MEWGEEGERRVKKEGDKEGGKDRKSERERNLLFFLSSFDSLKSAYFFSHS